MRTRSDLVSKAAEELGVLAAGQSLSAEDYDAINAEVPGLIDRLARRAVVYLADADQIEDGYLAPLAVLLAETVDSNFGTKIEREDRLEAEAQLRHMNSVAAIGEPARPLYF